MGPTAVILTRCVSLPMMLPAFHQAACGRTSESACLGGNSRDTNRVRRVFTQRSLAEGNMPFVLEIEPDSGMAIATCTGVLTLDEARRGVSSLWEHPAWGGVSAVWDFREARLSFSTPEIREAAQFVLAHQPKTPPSRMAFVTANDADFGLVRMFEVFRESPATEVRVFRDMAEAITWARVTAEPKAR